MLEGSKGSRWALIAGILLLTVALAGCAQDQGPGAGSNTTDGDDGGEAVTQAEARSSYKNALSVISEGADDAERVGMTMTFTNESASGNESGTMEALSDETKNLTIMSMRGSFAEGSGMSATSGEVEVFVAGQVHKTTFFGVPPDVLGFYNESAEPPEGFTSVDSSPEAGPSGGSDEAEASLSDPTTFMNRISEEPPEDAEYTATETTYNGEPAIEIETSYTEENATFDVRAVVYTDPSRPALIEGNVEALEGTDAADGGTFKLEFTYGEDATHELEEGLIRLEAMTFSSGASGSGMMMGQQDAGAFTNRTIQPSQNPGLVALDEVEVQVTPSSGGPGGDSQPVLMLAAEEGTAENEDVRVTFEDADGDGAVSPGDRVVLEDLNTSDDQRFSISLHDEVSGLNLSPGPGLAVLVGMLALVGAKRRRD